MSIESKLEKSILGYCESIVEIAERVRKDIAKGEDMNELGEFQDLMFKADRDIIRLQTTRNVENTRAELERMMSE